MNLRFKAAALKLLTLDGLQPVAKAPEFKFCAAKIHKV